MNVYVLTKLSGNGTTEPYDTCAARKRRGQQKSPASGAKIDLLIYQSTDDVTDLTGDSDFYVFYDGSYSFSSLESWFSSVGATGHGVTAQDTAEEAGYKIAQSIRSGSIQASGSMSAMFGNGESGDYIDASVASGVQYNGAQVSSPNDSANQLVGSVNGAWDVRGGRTGFWTGSSVDRASGSSRYEKFIQNNNTSTGYCLAAKFMIDGTVDTALTDHVDMAWMRDHDYPHMVAKYGTQDIWLRAFSDTLSYTVSNMGDGQFHWYMINYLPGTEKIRFGVDGTVVSEIDATGHVHKAWHTPAILCGTRRGIGHELQKLFFIDRGITQPEETVLADFMG